MEALEKNGLYVAPTLDAFEEVIDRALEFKQGRVFADTWDIGFLSSCAECFELRKHRLEQMNLKQVIYKRIPCRCNAQ
jgi:hypothetical protein